MKKTEGGRVGRRKERITPLRERNGSQARKVLGILQGIQPTLLPQGVRGNLRSNGQLGPGEQTQDELTRSPAEG